MEIIVVALGSAGDVHPFIGIAIQLQRRGHAVSFLTNAYFEQTVRQAGLHFQPIGLVDEYIQTVSSPRLWNPTKGMEILWPYFFEPAMRRTYEFIRNKVTMASCLVLASPLAFGARLAHEKLGVQLITGYLAPANLRTCHGPLHLAGTTIPAWVPHWCRKILWHNIDQRILDPLVCPALNAYRHELGLSPVRHVFGDWYHQATMALTLFPAWFAQSQADWPENLVLGDFPLFDCALTEEISPAVEAFLKKGDKPLIFMPGSAMRHAKEFFQTSMEACVDLGRRAIFLTQHQEQIPKNLPSNVAHFAYVPFSQLLSQATGLIHHGGIGSCAQALRAGIPQLIMPMAYDQFDNAARVYKLGCGISIKRLKYKNPLLKQQLQTLLKSEMIRMKCQQIAQRFRDTKPSSTLCDFIEMLGVHPQTMLSKNA